MYSTVTNDNMKSDHLEDMCADILVSTLPDQIYLCMVQASLSLNTIILFTYQQIEKCIIP